MGKKLVNPPVYFVLGQVKFNSIPNLSSTISEIVESLKDAYPDYRTEISREIILKLDEPEGTSKAKSDTVRHRHYITDIGGHSGYLLEDSSLIYFTTNYDIHEKLFEEIIKGLTAVNGKTNRIGVTHRIGIRYLNGIATEQKDYPSLAKMLNAGLLGSSEHLNGDLVRAYSENQKQLGDMVVMVRAMTRKNGTFGLPGELQINIPDLNTRFMGEKGVHTILDLDSWIEKREKFDLKRINTILKQLHDTGVRPAFDAATTDYARKIWNQK